MRTRISATLAFLFFAGSAVAGTLDACNLLSSNDLEQLQVPNGAAASPDWSEKDRMHSCKYTLRDSFKLLVAFGKPPDESIRKIQAVMEQAKSAPPKDVRPGTDGAFSDSGFCVTVAAPESQIISCTGIRGDTLFTVVVMRSGSIELTKMPASSLLHIFDGIFSRLTL